MRMMKGTAISAVSVSAHSRTIITERSATIVPTCRTAISRTLDESRARRLTSFKIRDIRSPECTSEKNESGWDWMWR